ncbi:MAG TPA: hypothetical protein VMV65_11055, partial [Alphaproteobacteria bacterium]|nr:hypothetical protein [Alphaproteobacteria bacterium]
VAGDRLEVRDADRRIELTAVPERSAISVPLVAPIAFAKISFAAMALLIMWRRPDDAAARFLALFLAALSFGITYDFAVFPSVWARIISQFLVVGSFLTANIALLAFACRFPSLPSRGLRSVLAKATPAISVAGALLVAAPVFLSFHLAGNERLVHGLFILPAVAQGAIMLAAFAALIDAYVTASPLERPRMRWLAGTLIVGLSGVVAIFAFAITGVNVNTPGIQACAYTMLVIPFGLAYVILRHRMLDIAFVVNRAVVYTGVSIVVVGTFIVFEWILGHFVEQNSRASTFLQLGGALVLGFSVRFIHNRVDQYVDDVFFRERHMAEAAVRRFAQEALLITDPEDLVLKTTDVAQGRMRLSACAFFAKRDGGFASLHSTFAHLPAHVGENDYAVLDMRTWRSPVSLHETQTALPGELALPMIVRGELTGFLLCGDKHNHEAFAPDERDALAQLARDAGIALDSLRVREIERELARLGGRGARRATGGGAAAL